MSNRTINLTDKLYDYLIENGVRESDAARELRAVTRATIERHQMQIAPEQGAFMAILIRLMGAKRTLEVGTFTGYSALVVAEALPDDGKVIACDVSAEWTSIAREYWEKAGIAHKIDLRLAPALETLNQLLADGESDSFDFAFIDADKSNYDGYYECCLKLLRTGGLIAIDNVLWNGAVVNDALQDDDTTAIRALNRKVIADDRVDTTLTPIGDGLTLAIKR
ncbi:MAG: class I SAM-dependent methyltransferase [Gammaproteobacteria bacterium]|nr:class I SAM-dependent methyltransferase [Gammaproteobacteria bacterium]